jgi:hypothetical protein
MLPPELWEALGLDPRIVCERAEFFEAFAGLVDEPAQPEPAHLAEISRAEGALPGLEAFGDPPGLGDEARMEEVDYAPAPRPPWQRAGIAADSLRQAAMARLLLDAEEGLRLLEAAGRRYMEASRPFGLLLLSVAGPEPAASEMAAAELTRWLDGGDRKVPAPEPLDYPQQIYLALAAASTPRRMQVRIELPGDFAHQPGARSATPIGTGGQSAASWWDFATQLLAGANPALPGPDREGTARRLVGLADGHGEQVERSQLDSYHWRNYGEGVDLLDLEVVAAVTLANRQLAAGGEPLTQDLLAPASPAAMVSLQVGLEVSGRDEGEPPTRERGRPQRMS